MSHYTHAVSSSTLECYPAQIPQPEHLPSNNPTPNKADMKKIRYQYG